MTATPDKYLANLGGSYSAAETAASYPTAALTPYQFLDRDASRASTDYAFTVPSGSPYSIYMAIPIDQTDITCVVDGNPRTVIYGTSAASGQVAIDKATGLVTFNSADSGLAGVRTDRSWLTPVNADFIHLLQAHIVKLEAEAIRLRSGLYVSRACNFNAFETDTSFFARITLPPGIVAATLTGLSVEASTYTNGVAATGNTIIEASLSPTVWSTTKTVTLGSSATYNRADVSSTPLELADTTGADPDSIYLRIGSSAGGHWLSCVTCEFTLKGA